MDKLGSIDWRAGEISLDRRRMFVLWAVHVGLCRETYEFGLHFNEGTEIEADLAMLQEEGFVKDQAGKLELTSRGLLALGSLAELTSDMSLGDESASTAPSSSVRKITRVMAGESLVGDGNEVAHIDLILGPRGSPAEFAFCNALTNNKDGFTALLAVVAPNLPCKPNTIIFNKVTIKNAKQAVQMFGPAQAAVARAVADCVADGTIPSDEADDIFICVGVFIHWEAADDKKIYDYNYRATKIAVRRAVEGRPTAAELKKVRRQLLFVNEDD